MNSAVRLLDEAALKYNDKIALADEWEEYSFKGLRDSAMNVGTFLINNIDSNRSVSPVIVYLKKSARCIISFMGILYSGNPYVPVPADIPMSRLEKIVENLNPACIITEENLVDNLSELNMPVKPFLYDDIIKTKSDAELIEKTVSCVIDTDPIYIMYTSGSTGVPKGVTVAHKGVIDYCIWTKIEFGFNETDVYGNQAPFYFDNSIFDIYGFLITGAKMIIIPEKLFMFPGKLPEFIRDNNITIIFWVPTVMINVANSGELENVEMPSLKYVLFCGEVMPNTQLNIWRKHYPNLLYANLYGPTEITDVCTYYVVDRAFSDSEPLPIGKACRNMRAIIINDDGKMLPKGETGELCIIGTGVSLGYWNSPEITNKAFIQNPTNPLYNERIYKTGDLAYFNEEDLLIYVGRMDSQIKLKGNRIELGEIEAGAMCVDGVENACALFNAEQEKIVLFVETKQELRLRLVNNELKKYIPKYMLPGELITMEKLPHTANDKINRVQLKKDYF